MAQIKWQERVMQAWEMARHMSETGRFGWRDGSTVKNKNNNQCT